METTKCKACGKEIFFAVNPKTKKKSPLVAKPITAFLLRDYLSDVGLPIAEPIRAYVSHFGDCPAAAKFSKPKPKGESPDGK